LFFFLMAFGFAWIILLVILLSQYGFIPLQVRLFPFGALGPYLGPTLAAFIMTATLEGKQGVLRLLGRYVQWRVGFSWYPLVLLGVPALLFLGALIVSIFSGMLQAVQFPLLPAALQQYALIFVPALVLFGPLGEEPGWRGFALPRLQQRYGALLGSLWLGLLWGVWHAPLYLIPGYTSQPVGEGTLFIWAQFAVATVLLTVCMTWVYNRTRGSLLIMILLHASLTFEAVIQQVFPPVVTNGFLFGIIGFGGAALLLVVLTKGRLAYHDGDGTHARNQTMGKRETTRAEA
jgi:membrane protease YdiL (CAAX protease family)